MGVRIRATASRRNRETKVLLDVEQETLALVRSYQTARAILPGGMSDHLQVPLLDLTDEGGFDNQRVGDGFSSEIFAKEAIRFLGEHDGRRPFFAYVAFTAPHDPRQSPPGYVDPFYEDLPPLPPNFLPQHPFDNGDIVARDEHLLSWPRRPEHVRDSIAEYYGILAHLDEQIGRILETLRQSPYADNTIVVFAGDHGLALGSHGLMGKQNLYEHSVRCPLIVKGPGIPAGASTTAMTYLHDLVPTLAGLAGVEMPHELDGEDLSPLWTGAAESVRDAVFHAYTDRMRTVRDSRYKLHVYPFVDHRLLFDLQADPHETEDLAGRTDMAEIEERLLALMHREQADYEDFQSLEIDSPAAKEIDLTGYPQTPDPYQPRWVLEKYF